LQEIQPGNERAELAGSGGPLSTELAAQAPFFYPMRAGAGSEERVMEIGAAGLDAVRAAAMAEHYQSTMGLVTHHWERRSRQFVTLVAVLGGAALVAFARPLIAPSLEAIIRERLPGLDSAAIARLKELTPVAGDLLLAFLVISVFYLTASLFNRSSVITNYYTYLEQIEAEIRKAFQIPADQIVFTREGDFYAAMGSDISNLIGRCYKAILGFLLVFFFAARLFFDYPADVVSLPPLDRAAILTFVAKTFLFAIDVLIVIPTIWLFVRFVRLGPMTRSEVRKRMDGQRRP
jgi:hypothetical protein